MKVRFIDQTLRDGQQSLWGLRLRPFQAAPALPHLDATGFHTIDLTGPGMFTILLRTYRENPWDATDFLAAGLPNNKLRTATRTNSVGVMGFSRTRSSTSGSTSPPATGSAASGSSTACTTCRG